MVKKVRALGLCSGGLDSILSALVLGKQGIEVQWVTFETPFFRADKALKAARNTGIPLTVRKITDIYLEMLKNPACGYGKHMNPCLDCHALMFRLAGEIMRDRDFDFLFSGEVLGQRPMSQTKPSLRYVEKHSGMDGYILRPLSAQCLPATIPEKEGWVSRNLLLGITGRGRKDQIRLAREFGITEYPAPAGGCLLTDKGYSRRLKDLFEHRADLSKQELELLKLGRHFRLDDRTKIIVGRAKKENEQISSLYDPATEILVKVTHFPSPIALITRGGRPESISLAASLCIGYSKAPKNQAVDVEVKTPGGPQTLTVIGIPPSSLKHLLI